MRSGRGNRRGRSEPAAARRTSRHGHEARRGLRWSRRETAAVSRDRGDLLGQCDAARDRTVSTHVTGSRSLRAEGRADQATGNIKQAGVKIRDASGH